MERGNGEGGEGEKKNPRAATKKPSNFTNNFEIRIFREL